MRGIDDAYLKQHRCGVFVGCAKGDYERVLEKCGLDLEGKSFTGNAASLIASNIAYYLDLKGPAYTVDTACSSSLTAVHVAAESILRGECDLAVVGGVNIFSSPTALIHTTQVGMQSKTGYCRTFDNCADGTVFSEACAAVVIKRLSRAISDSDPIYAVIAGTAINQDGKTNGITAPSSQSQIDLITQALKNANIDSSKIKYVEAHGTATPLGDPIEVHALSAAYSDYDCANGKCLIGSIKSNIGHSGYCSGLVGLIKCALSIKYDKLPPTINYSQPNANIAFERTPFEVNTKLSEWPQSRRAPKYCGVSAFGFGGSNAHVILRGFENEIEPGPMVANKSDQLTKYVLLSGKDLTHLTQNIEALRQYLLFCAQNGIGDSERELNIENIAYTLELTRKHYGHRIGILAGSVGQLESCLTKASCDITLCAPGTFINGVSEGLYQTPSERRANKSKHDSGKGRYRGDLMEQWLNNGETQSQLLNDYSPTARRICLPGHAFAETRVWPDCSTRISERRILPVKNYSPQYPAEGNEKKDITIACVIDILAEISGLEASEIRPEMSITDLGIDSINIRKLSYSLQERFGRMLNIGKVYACKNIKEVWEQLLESNIIFKVDDTEKIGRGWNEHSIARDEKEARDGIAIIGYSFCLPGANSDKALWKILKTGKSVTASVEFSNSPIDNSNCNTSSGANTDLLFAGLIDDKYYFDYEFFGINEREAVHICPQHRQLLQHTYAAIENAGVNVEELAGRRVGVFVAVGDSNYDSLIESNHSKIGITAATGTLASLASNRISYQFDFRGPSETLNTACSSGLVALSRAFDSIGSGECDYAVVGASNVITSPFGHLAFGNDRLLSADGCTRPFIEGGSGFVRSEGTVVFFLQRVSNSVKEKSHVHALVRSVAVGHGGRGGALSAPNPMALSQIIKMAYDKAQVCKSDVEYIEAHGSGTELGDTIEVEALREAFSNELNQKEFCGDHEGRNHSVLIGSIKANLGHTEVVSGLTGILKVILQYRYNQIAMNRYSGENVISPLFLCEFFKLSTKNTDWATSELTGRRIAGVNSIGLGGVNAHAVLSDYCSHEQRANECVNEIEARSKVFLFSERTNTYLVEYLQKFIEYLNDSVSPNMDAIASTLAFGRSHRSERLVCIAETKDELVKMLDTYILNCLEAQTGRGDVRAHEDKPDLKGRSRILGKAIEERQMNMCKEWVNGNDVDIPNLISKRSCRIPIPGRQLAKKRCWINDGEPVRRSDRSRIERIQCSDYYKFLNETSWYGENHGR